MGKKSNKKRKRTKSKQNGYSRNNNQTVQTYKTSICRTPHVCPDVMCVQMKYSQKVDFSSTLYDTRVFRGNSINDPDFTGLGGQAMGHDQWRAFYRRYRVTGSSCTLEVEARGTEAVTPILIPLNTNAIPTSPQPYLEAAYAIKGEPMRSTGDSNSSLYSYVRTNQIRGGPKDIVQYEADLSSLFNANPSQQWYWHVVVYNPGSALTNIEGSFTATIRYYVELYDRETLTIS